MAIKTILDSATPELTLVQRSILQYILTETIDYTSPVIGTVKDTVPLQPACISEYNALLGAGYIRYHRDPILGNGYVGTLKAWRLAAK